VHKWESVLAVIFGVFFFLDYGVSILVLSSLQTLVAPHPVDNFVAVAFVSIQSH
jgi:predicted ferric reductase